MIFCLFEQCLVRANTICDPLQHCNFDWAFSRKIVPWHYKTPGRCRVQGRGTRCGRSLSNGQWLSFDVVVGSKPERSDVTAAKRLHTKPTRIEGSREGEFACNGTSNWALKWYQYTYMTHFFANPLSILLAKDPTQVPLQKEHFEAVRNLPSFRR